MAKLRVQAQHLQAGDIVGSGEKVLDTYQAARTPSGKIEVVLEKTVKGFMPHHSFGERRNAQWNKTTMIGIERAEKVNENN